MKAGEFELKDYRDSYGSIMQFNRNKNTYIHGWYPFVEGYSKEFIRSIVNEYKTIFDENPKLCLEPFTGSGTTPVELQKLNIKCKSFEVSPFMYNLAKAKMENSYKVATFKKYIDKVKVDLQNTVEDIENIVPLNASKRIVEKEGLDKWNFDKEVMRGILDIKYSINSFKSPIYKRIFMIALASILLEVSNVYRNGKCISYKKNWNKNTITRIGVHNIYLNRLEKTFLPDIKKMEQYKNENKLMSNSDECFYGDVRKNIVKKVEDNSIDLVITSPPYLNSRDYTDTYMIELRVLDFLKNDEEVRKLRKKTIRSHVQVKWGKTNSLEIDELALCINRLKEHEKEFWNRSLIHMVEGYFDDMNTLFKELYKKVRKGGLIYFNVANSAYYNVEIKTDEIISKIAEINGFKVKEIREARRISPSSQQKDKIEYLRESVIVIAKQ